jgi:hypothetical protein
MDLVYTRSISPIALLETALQSEAQLTALRLLYDWGRLQRDRGADPPTMETEIWSVAGELLDFLEAISYEKWASRAWTLQESLSSQDKMLLLFRSCPELASDHASITPRAFSSSQYILEIEVLSDCVEWARQLFTTHSEKYTQERMVKFLELNRDRIATVLDRLQDRVIQERHVKSVMPQFRFGWPKRTCNAAVALTYLRHRDNFVVSDRLSILANLCDYQIRLNIAEVVKRQYPLSSAIVALSLLNGDCSLLIPEVYGNNELQDPSESGFSLRHVALDDSYLTCKNRSPAFPAATFTISVAKGPVF